METATRAPAGETDVRRVAVTDGYFAAGLAALVLLGFWLRWTGTADFSISHPEIYVPGMSLSPETVTPPPRHGFPETLLWHFHREPHPVGYYMAMLGWTSLFGDSEMSVRAPSVLFGTGSILLIYRLGAALYGRGAGFAAAALLAFHGFHIFWSGMARMYVPGAFFALLATLLLVKLATESRRSAWLGAAYIAALVAGLYTTELVWAVFAAHVGWAAFYAADARRARLPILHVIAFTLSAPALLHAVYLARGEAVASPSLAFLAQYFAFGFIFEHDEFSDPIRFVNGILIAAALILSLALTFLGLRRGARAQIADQPSSTMRMTALAAFSAAAFAVMIGLAMIARQRNAALFIVSLLPVAAFAWPFTARLIRPTLRKVAPPVERVLGRADAFSVLIGLIALAAPLAILAVSLGKSVAAYRAFIVFVPFLLLLAGAGLAELWRRKALLTAASIAAGALFGASVAHAAPRPASPVDYNGLASEMLKRLRPDDLILIRRAEWLDAPITYYLPHDRIIGARYAERIDGALAVWIIRWEEHRISPADVNIAEAIAGYTLCETVRARRAAAKRYVKNAADCRSGA